MARANNLSDVGIYVRERMAFTHRSMGGVRYDDRNRTSCRFGDLPSVESAKLRTALSDLAGMARGAAVYVVYSYDTPIGWVTSDGDVYVPDVTYSPTTTNHQGIVARNLPRSQP